MSERKVTWRLSELKHYQPERATRIRPSILITITPSLIWMCEGGGYGISPSSYRG